MFSGRKLPLTLAFIVLVGLAFGASCNGFFVDPTLSSITIQPPSPRVQVGESMTLQAWGTDSENHRSQIKSGVVWTSSDPSVKIDQNTGQITGEGTGGTSTVTAAAQGLSATATATAFLGDVTNLALCTGTFDTGTCPASTWNISTTQTGTKDYYLKGVSNGNTLDITTVATWQVTPAPTAGGIQCDASSSPAVCTVDQNTTVGAYTLTVTYPNLPSLTASIIVGP